MVDFISEYFLNPVLDRTGYNTINTAAYAIIALACAYLIFKLFERLKIKFDRTFTLYTLPFILLGSTVRVITDSIDTNVMQSLASSPSPLYPLYNLILSSHLYDYSFLTTTPGIYIIVGLLAIASAIISFHLLKRPKLYPLIALALWLPHFLLILLMSQHWLYLALVLALALIPAALAYKFVLQHSLLPSFAVFAHSFDGAATFVVIDIFGPAAGKSYFEQHVVSNLLGSTPLGFFLFFLVKVLFSAAASYLIMRDKASESEKSYILLLLIIFGLAPGIRDALRMLVGA
jgi:uncharacterized membrane protein